MAIFCILAKVTRVSHAKSGGDTPRRARKCASGPDSPATANPGIGRPQALPAKANPENPSTMAELEGGRRFQGAARIIAGRSHVGKRYFARGRRRQCLAAQAERSRGMTGSSSINSTLNNGRHVDGYILNLLLFRQTSKEHCRKDDSDKNCAPTSHLDYRIRASAPLAAHGICPCWQGCNNANNDDPVPQCHD